jgi:hypothetical protein
MEGKQMNSHSLVLSEHAQRRTHHTAERDGANATSIVGNSRGQRTEPNLVNNSKITELDGRLVGDQR